MIFLMFHCFVEIHPDKSNSQEGNEKSDVDIASCLMPSTEVVLIIIIIISFLLR